MYTTHKWLWGRKKNRQKRHDKSMQITCSISLICQMFCNSLKSRTSFFYIYLGLKSVSLMWIKSLGPLNVVFINDSYDVCTRISNEFMTFSYATRNKAHIYFNLKIIGPRSFKHAITHREFNFALTFRKRN